MTLPIKTTFEDVDALTKYLRSQVGWVEIDKAKTAIPAKHLDNRKLDAMKFIGLLDRDGPNIKLSSSGQAYADGDEAARSQVLQRSLRSVPLYLETLEWLHHSSKGDQTKTQIANYWHDSHFGKLDSTTGAALTDAVIFFMRVVEASGLSHFVPAGRGRPESFLQVDATALQEFVSEAPGADDPHPGSPPEPSLPVVTTPAALPALTAPPQAAAPAVSLVPGVHINIEIHIAADSTPATVEEIFKNMRKYVLNDPDSAE